MDKKRINKRVIISITGVPGTGKTWVSEELGKLLDLKVINSNHMDFKKDYDTKRQCFILNISEVQKFISKKLKEENFKDGFIFDSHLSHLIDSKFVKHCFVLRCNPTTLKERLMKRDYSKEKIRENIESEIIDLVLLEALSKKHRVHEIDMSKKDYKEAAKEIKSVLDKKRKSKYGSINFLKYVPDYIC